ncbi:GNAT family N-acetyltransferase, partial [Candidatus Woesearchaeota archaeon]
EAYKPDALKIYPTTVIRGTGLWGMWRAGKYKPISTEQACDIILETKKHVPKWCRIMRVQRDIPSTEINAGPSLNNLRQMIHKKMEERGVCCKCIRCREPKEQEVDWKSATLEREDYLASEGREIFLSYTDKKNDYLLGFLRLRIIPESHRPEIRAGSAGIRELHVYGSSTSLGCEGKVQHRGIGKMLMAEAEKIAKEEFKCKKITVIAGIGVREYYYKLGYKKDGPYVSKNL